MNPAFFCVFVIENLSSSKRISNPEIMAGYTVGENLLSVIYIFLLWNDMFNSPATFEVY